MSIRKMHTLLIKENEIIDNKNIITISNNHDDFILKKIKNKHLIEL